MKHVKIKLIQLPVFLSLIASALLISGCSDSAAPENGQGQIKVMMVDAPAGYDQVNIVVTRVEIHKNTDPENSWVIINNVQAAYDLLLLRNGSSVVIGSSTINAGPYSQIRLIIGPGSNVVVNGITHPLDIPSGEQSGLKLNHSFEIQPGLLYELLLDFDAERSIVLTGSGQYKLKPVIRVVPVVISGTISGVINPVSAAGFIYAISGTDTSGTIADQLTGSFKLMALLQQTFRIEVFSANAAYNDTTISNVAVTARQNYDLGTINLSLK